MKYKKLMTRLGVFAFLMSISPALLPAQSSDSSENMDGELDSEEVETTVFDLERYINMPESARLRRESDEDLNNQEALFSDPETRKSFFGDAPPYVYIPQGVDPMIIPWIRNDIVAEEIYRDVQSAFIKAKSMNDLATVRTALKKIEDMVTQYPNSSSTVDSQKLNTEMREWIEIITDGTTNGDPPPKPIPPGGPVDLPSWVVTNTKGIILDAEDPSQSVVLVGDSILKPGDSLAGQFVAISVKEIKNKTVIYEYLDIDHAVLVESN